jgi:tRNA pseudouridine38-40 synthase
MRTLKLTLAYDGTNYSGWQSQPDRVTLQETLERALARVACEPIRVMASGRTDAGVHALGQVVSLQTSSALPTATLHKALNSELPHDMAVLEVAEAASDFHAIASAHRKRYRYLLDDRPVRDVFRRDYAWYSHLAIDVAAMQRAARALVGTHDFASFQTAGSERRSTVRTVFELSIARVGPQLDGIPGQGQAAVASAEREIPSPQTDSSSRGLISLEIEADGFLYNMVRTIVGTLLEVGQGRRGEAWPAEALAALDRRAAGRTAPAHGLFLVHVHY